LTRVHSSPSQAFRFTPRTTTPHVSADTGFEAKQHHATPTTNRSDRSAGNSRAAASVLSASPVPRFKAEDWDKVVARGSVTGSPAVGRAPAGAPPLSIAAGSGVPGGRLFRENGGQAAAEQQQEEKVGAAPGSTRVEERVVPTMARPPPMGALSGMHLGSQLMAEVVQVRRALSISGFSRRHLLSWCVKKELGIHSEIWPGEESFGWEIGTLVRWENRLVQAAPPEMQQPLRRYSGMLSEMANIYCLYMFAELGWMYQTGWGSVWAVMFRCLRCALVMVGLPLLLPAVARFVLRVSDLWALTASQRSPSSIMTWTCPARALLESAREGGRPALERLPFEHTGVLNLDHSLIGI
jgi:hypothetical protein